VRLVDLVRRTLSELDRAQHIARHQGDVRPLEPTRHCALRIASIKSVARLLPDAALGADCLVNKVHPDFPSAFERLPKSAAAATAAL
jgi:hypothetical protein